MSQKKIIKKNSGSTLAISFVIAVVSAIVILSISRLIAFNTHQASYFNSMENARRLADTGMNAAIAQLTKDPDPDHVPSTPVYVYDQQGTYENHVYRPGGLFPSPA